MYDDNGVNVYASLTINCDPLRTTKMIQTRDFYTIPQAARICGVDRTTMWSWVKSGNVEALVTPGGHHRILQCEIDKLLKKAQALPEKKSRARTVLVVDDEPLVLKTFTRLLKRKNYQVETASDGFQAGMKVVQLKPDLVVLDLFMPGIDGFEVCRTIKTNPELKSIMVIAMTGQDSPENESRILGEGADFYIAKTANSRQILDLIDSSFEVNDES